MDGARKRSSLVLFETRLQPIKVEDFAHAIKRWFVTRALVLPEYESALGGDETYKRFYPAASASKSFTEWTSFAKDYIEQNVRVDKRDDGLFRVIVALGKSRPQSFFSSVLSRKWHDEAPQFALRRGWQLNRIHYASNYVFEPNFGVRVENVPSVLYHVTRTQNQRRINKQGIVPANPASVSFGHRQQERHYAPRIYLSTSYDAAIDIGMEFQVLDEVPMIVYRIDASKCLPGTKFYVDSEADDAVWTYSRIPHIAISLDHTATIELSELMNMRSPPKQTHEHVTRLLSSYLTELRRDESFLALLHAAGLRGVPGHDRVFAEDLAEGWLEDMELATGRMVAPGVRFQVVRFVESRFPGLVVRFRGNKDAARMTMLNLLDARFRSLAN